jgi:salicylate hydroxylase
MSSEYLQKVFDKFAKMRQPRTAALVRGARAQGENRVMDGAPEASIARDEVLRKAWQDKPAVETKYDQLLKEPY